MTIAKERGGKLISETVGNAKTKLLWQCKNGHTWKGQTGQIVNGRWCPECSSSLGERICRAYFEQIFNNKFPKSYPAWLKTIDNNQLELDGYCKFLQIAFEHQGRQHYECDGWYIKNKEQLKKRKQYDKLKKELCEKNGIKLVEIREIGKNIKIEMMKNFLKQEFQKLKISIPDNFNSIKIDLSNAYSPSSEEILKELKEIAEGKGGLLLSKGYLGCDQRLLWQCKKGHKWKVSAGPIRNSGTWCPKCAGKNKTIVDMRKLAKEKDGKCLSKKYYEKNKKLLWQCKEGHEFIMSPNNVVQGHWCQICAKNHKKTIEEMRKLALARKGKCLSKNYKNAKQILSWQCKKGHKFEMSVACVKRGYWCQKCAGNKKLTLEDAQQEAIKRGGKLLSDVYKNNRTKLTWQCKRGHMFSKTLEKVRNRKSWCPNCK